MLKHCLFIRNCSQLKHKIHSDWPASQFEMLQKLHESGGNRVWETLLLDPTKESKIKLRPGDSSEKREKFINEKYVHQGKIQKSFFVTEKFNFLLSQTQHSFTRMKSLTRIGSNCRSSSSLWCGRINLVLRFDF